MTTDNNTNKNSKKRSPEEDDFDALRQYILACPLVSNPADNAAVKAAIRGLDDELKRRARDAKLQKKFAGSSAVKTEPRQDAAAADEEWQDIAEERNKTTDRSSPSEEVEVIDNSLGDTSFLGKRLSEEAIAAVAQHGVRAKTPLAAVSVALHAAMISPTLGFACTGCAHDKDQKKSSGGFAPSIRELPKTQFLPKDWDKYAKNTNTNTQESPQAVLRYRKQGTGSVLLRVENIHNEEGADEVAVKLLPANTKEPPSQSLNFPLQDHINLVSWTAAQKKSGGSGLEPAIHYKGLPVLMTAFAKAFDLGSINDEKKEEPAQRSAFPGMEKCSTEAQRQFANPICVTDGQARRVGYERPTIDNVFPQRPMAVGDFHGDLKGPSSFGIPHPGGPGSLMGPNHPMFQGRGGGLSGVGDGSGFGMRPRFDPFGPPGGPQEIDPLRAGPDGRPLPPHMRPPRGGNPNPDHLRPPNSLGGNMFS